jgi:hypothetical protein
VEQMAIGTELRVVVPAAESGRIASLCTYLGSKRSFHRCDGISVR